jgi:hypothetical protein
MSNEQRTISREEVNGRIGHYLAKRATKNGKGIKDRLACFNQVEDMGNDAIVLSMVKTALGECMEDLYIKYPEIREKVAQIKAERVTTSEE